MTLKSLPILVIIFLLLVPNFVTAQSLPPLLLLTVEEIGMRVKDDTYFGKMLAEDTDSSGNSETHGAPFQVTGSTQKKSKIKTQLEDFEARSKSMKEKFNKRQTKNSDDFEKRRTKMSVQFLQRISILKKKHQERYDFWDRYVERYLKDMAGYKKALINPQEFAEEEKREEEERKREIEHKINE